MKTFVLCRCCAEPKSRKHEGGTGEQPCAICGGRGYREDLLSTGLLRECAEQLEALDVSQSRDETAGQMQDVVRKMEIALWALLRAQ